MLLLFLLSFYSSTNQLDINRATLEQIRQLPVDTATARRIYERVELFGRLNSVYDLLRVPGVSYEKFAELKPLVYVSPSSWEENRLNTIQRIQRRLASEEGPTAAAVEQWQDLLVTPININRAWIDDLLVLDNVSLVDAVAVVKFTGAGGKLSGRRDLANQVPGLSSYGYRSLRDFVTFDDVRGLAFSGNYRANYDGDPNWFVSAGSAEFDQALATLDADTLEFRNAGYTAEQIEFFRARLIDSRSFRTAMNNQSSIRHRLRVRLGEPFRLGGWTVQKLYTSRPVDEYKLFASASGIGPLRKAIVGDYRLTLAQGLLMDNNSELVARVHERTVGLYSDLSENPGFGLRGGAFDIGTGRQGGGVLGFYSRSRRDAILNPDSSVNYYIVSTPRYPAFRNKLQETDYGGSAYLDLSGVGFFPVGTRLAFNGLRIAYDRPFRPGARWLELPGDSDTLEDPNYTALDSGSTRFYYGVDFRTVVENFSFEGELALKPKTGSASVQGWLPTQSVPKAMIVKGRTQYDYLYVTVLYRRYDVGYDNPYNRGFSEQARFEDTPLEKPYRLIDPVFAALQDFPLPKAEEGVFADMRYQVGRQITFTRVYVDIWRNLAWGADNVRFQGEVEYRPVFPLRLRFKQKLQSKELPKLAGATRSNTLESSIRAMASLSNWDWLTGEVRLGKVLLTPTLRYTDQSSISGNFVSVQWEHNFSNDLQGELGVAAWMTRGMSQWALEDNGIDFLEGQGLRWYAALTDRISDNLLVYFKVRHKLSEFPHTGLGGREGLHYRNSLEPVRDFVSREETLTLSVQFDLLW